MTFDRTKRLPSRARMQHCERGYALLTLMLFVALMVIAAAAVAPRIAFEIKRDREAELVHRGVEYSRAIQRFTKVKARYPLRLEELQASGDTKFIRKLYKDPITRGDFRLLYLSDISAAEGARLPGGAASQDNGTPTPAQGSPTTPIPPDSSGNVTTPATADGATPVAPSPSTSSTSTSNNASGGGAIVGVASKSKARTIREFDKKNHYNDWLFFYMPRYSRGQRTNAPTSLTLPPAVGLNPGATNQDRPQTAPPSVSSPDQQ